MRPRARMARLWEDIHERTAIGVIAPGGFGKTTLLHLKNLFAKLSAGTRKHAVDRARLLGMLAA